MEEAAVLFVPRRELEIMKSPSTEFYKPRCCTRYSCWVIPLPFHHFYLPELFCFLNLNY